MSRRALVVCPGRGSYTREGLGQLKGRGARVDAMLDVCDAYRSNHGRPGVRELDAAEAYRSTLHVAGENASLLTFACTLADYMSIDPTRYEVVGVTGNSMGWYSALAVAGALPIEQAIELVDTMGAYQAGNVIGGQVLLPACVEVVAGRLEDAVQVAAIDEVLKACNAAGHTAEWSIRLGGYAVLGADKAGVKYLLEHLPKSSRGANAFPMQLPLHSAFHTSLLRDTAQQAQSQLSSLRYRAPDVPLIDGRGRVFRPVHADPDELSSYTLGHQIVAPYDLNAAITTALRHTGAEVVIALGPGNSLGGPLARTAIAHGWHAIRDKQALIAAQASAEPRILSFGVPEQRAQIV